MEFEIEIKDEKPKKPKRKSKKKIIKYLIIIFFICIFLAISLGYTLNEEIRNYMDYNILNKIIEEENTRQIELGSEGNTYVCSYSNYIGVLNNNKLQAYNSYAKMDFELDIDITEPIFDSNQQYLAIAEKNGKKIYMIVGKNIIWQLDVEGEISSINVNKNGYLSVIVSQNTYKVVIAINPKGKELFKYFLSNSYAIDTEISNNNKYLAIAEISTEGTKVESGIRILSMDKVENDIENLIIYQKNAKANQMITGIKYDNSNNLIAKYDDEITQINQKEEKTLFEFNTDTLFSSIELNRAFAVTQLDNNTEYRNSTITKILNTSSNGQAYYKIDAIPKNITTKKDIIAINAGTEAYIIGDNGFLKKKYFSKQEIKQILIGENIVGIVYKNKINIIKL